MSECKYSLISGDAFVQPCQNSNTTKSTQMHLGSATVQNFIK